MHQPDDQPVAARAVQRHRRQLEAVAYRMLGSVGEAEDAVQEAWLRVSRSRPESIDNVGGFLARPSSGGSASTRPGPRN